MTCKTLLSRVPLLALSLLFVVSLSHTGMLADTAARQTAAAATVPVGGTTTGVLRLVTANGRPVDLNKFRGKAVFVNLWATWCAPCRVEMPGIEALAARTDTSKVAFVLISLDKNPEKALKFMQRQGFRLPVYFPAAPLPPPFNSQTIPNTVILSPDGHVAARYEGLVDYDTPEFRQALEKLAARP
ncbi:TlpA family protein disulfide reductase [Hymenobacter lapidiphilus]|uniref:TlpA family protein disulfide reductase n=1 Tax=Hymenobacter lapidiphilus TaxID=2608003 RepID=A0A7Y7U4T9_9BACT|nr:TlpA disulfide reductase family protein [Hymenobacter lapidiphilus]NVO29775.1 TlpA family protein disulfide reductase [Hymenobacter lapidiphilus]